MNIIYKTRPFADWLDGLKDIRTQGRIHFQIRKAEMGNFGDHASVGDGVYEMRLHFGPGYRLYYFRHGDRVYYLLAGGDKTSQSKDIARAKMMKNDILSGGER